MRTEPAVRVTASGGIEPGQVPRHVAENLAQSAYHAMVEALRDPLIQADYKRWKEARERRDSPCRRRTTPLQSAG